MATPYMFSLSNPNFSDHCLVEGIANANEPHDRSAPTDYHWKILKCRMIIFSDSSVLACPDKADIKKIYVVYRSSTRDHEKIIQLFKKFKLSMKEAPQPLTAEIYQSSFQYTMTARLAPTWNLLGQTLYVNNREFLTTAGPQDAVDLNINVLSTETIITLKPFKVNILRTEEPQIGDYIRVLPSLFKAVVNDMHEKLPEHGAFRCYKDLRRHWKNIHGYRLPEEEGSYCSVRFWRGEPLIYPQICVLTQYPIKTPLPKKKEEPIIVNFVECLKAKMTSVLGSTLSIKQKCNDDRVISQQHRVFRDVSKDTQAISLCTPTQQQKSIKNYFPVRKQ